LSSVFGERSGYNLKRLSKFADTVLVQAKRCVGYGGDGARQLNLDSASTRAQAVILGEHFEDGNSRVDGTVDIVGKVVGGSANEDGGDSGGVPLRIVQNGANGSTNLANFASVTGANFFLGRGPNTRKSGSAKEAAKAAKIKLGHDLDKHELASLKKMQCEFVDGATSNHDVHSRISDFIYHLLHGIFFGFRVVHELAGVLQQNGALGLGGGKLDANGENCDLGILNKLNDTLRIARNNKSGYDR
jgi:hypothetical protein